MSVRSCVSGRILDAFSREVNAMFSSQSLAQSEDNRGDASVLRWRHPSRARRLSPAALQGVGTAKDPQVQRDGCSHVGWHLGTGASGSDPAVLAPCTQGRMVPTTQGLALGQAPLRVPESRLRVREAPGAGCWGLRGALS